MLEAAAQERWIWPRSVAQRYYLAGGGDEHALEFRWQRRLSRTHEAARQLAANQLHTAGGGIEYVVAVDAELEVIPARDRRANAWRHLGGTQSSR
jgi:hypothetical protein